MKKLFHRLLHFLRIKPTTLNMLDAHKLKRLKEACVEVKLDIERYQNYDPENPDKAYNQHLYAFLDATYRKIQDIEINNGINLDNI